MKRDGHIHTPFCPHGSSDLLELYIEKAISSGFTDISFTEHAPLPANFDDPTPDQDSGMNPDYLDNYFLQLAELQKYYRSKINIRIGLEVDYIIGYEKETTAFLNEVGPRLDDAILSVHFLRHEHTYSCIDFSETEFMRFAEQVGSVKKVYDLYYNTLETSILADLGPYKPKRIGHPTLVHKFQHFHGETIDDDAQVKLILQLMKEQGYELDYNGAGLSKKHCLEPYPPIHLFEYAQSIELPYVFGSDAHTVKDLHQHYTKLF